MRLSISNIAWDVAEDAEVAALLQRHDVDAIDIAPGKYFPRPAQATTAEIDAVSRWWAQRGIQVVGMQALLFGTSGLNVFGDAASQAALLSHLGAVCRIGGTLGATRLVFGSPKNRDRGTLDDDAALDIAAGFFRRAGALAAEEGVLLCLEPNPPCYGANFMTDSLDTARVVRAVDHPAVCMQWDTGAMTINDEDPAQVAPQVAELIGHVHASEPSLVPLGDGATDHARMAAVLAGCLPQSIVTIEMVATTQEPHLQAIERAVQVAQRHYRHPAPAPGRAGAAARAA